MTRRLCYSDYLIDVTFCGIYIGSIGVWSESMAFMMDLMHCKSECWFRGLMSSIGCVWVLCFVVLASYSI